MIFFGLCCWSMETFWCSSVYYIFSKSCLCPKVDMNTEKIVLTCGHRVESFEQAHEITTKDSDNQGTRYLRHSLVCASCKSKTEHFRTQQEANSWFKGYDMKIMNIAEKAGFIVDDENIVWKNYDDELKNFAKILIQECIDELNHPRHRENRVSMRAAALRLQNHFGILE